ncbi:probable disease resistance protein At5g66900 [Rosa chinensis]|uniref:probable disease resistance protein At5g66900 n=1 Tax=Rosa chinensis TaxID=74649 RepID=UPI001AD8B70F|nr:probable disease resistance protein At5g66900 [Rosa chinensis]
MANPVDVFAGAGGGLLFNVLYDGLKELTTKYVLFKHDLKSVKSTLESLEQVVQEIARLNEDLDRLEEELASLKTQLEEGKVLVAKCGKVRVWSVYKKYKYSKKLLGWNDSLKEQLEMLKVHAIRDGKETLTTVKRTEKTVSQIKSTSFSIKEGVEQIETNTANLQVVVSRVEASVSNIEAGIKQMQQIEAWCAVPELPTLTVGLDGPLNELKMKLFNNGVSMVVLTAPGGCGKTTLATKFCQDEQVQGSREGCKGFPLAITVAGKSLCGQPIEIWQERLIKWSKHSSILDSETELLLRLQTSLDVSNKEMSMVKECFLDLGSFPEDQRIPVAALIDIWTESYDSLDQDILCVANLHQITNRSLANLVVTRKDKLQGDGYYSEHFVTQHDLLRELAIYETRQEDPGHRERLIINISKDNFPKWWSKQNNGSIQFSHAWPNLVEVNIDYCNDLVALPADTSDLILLEKLSITNCHKLLALPEDIGKLAKLELLRLRSCTGLAKLPGSTGNLKKLKSLDISYCFSIKELPEDFGELSSLRELNMRDCSRLQELPLSVSNLEHLKVIGDDETQSLWQPFLPIKGTHIVVVKENINLNWLPKFQF